MTLLSLSCLTFGAAVLFDAVQTSIENRRLSLARIRSLAARHGLPERR
jgi:hypothetical protein